MICWSCERAAGEGPLCANANCGALLPPQAGRDHFAVLGLARRQDVDLAATEAQFRNLSRQFHPDRFAKADPRARRASLQRSVQLNEAWRTVKDPVRRAEYLLKLAGYEVGAETGASAPGRGAGTARERIAVPPGLLPEILELREELGEAREVGDDGRVQTMARNMRGRVEAALSRAAEALAEAAGAPGSDESAPAYARAADELIAVRYFRRFLDEVATHDEEVADGDVAASKGIEGVPRA